MRRISFIYLFNYLIKQRYNKCTYYFQRKIFNSFLSL